MIRSKFQLNRNYLLIWDIFWQTFINDNTIYYLYINLRMGRKLILENFDFLKIIYKGVGKKLSIVKFKRHLKFNSEEFRDLLVVSIVFGFIASLGFDSGVSVDFSRAAWSGYMMTLTFFSIVLMFVYVLSQKLVGIAMGYDVSYKIWYLGLLLGVLGGFISQGILFLLLPGAVFVKTIPHLRITKYFTSYDFLEDAWIHFMGLAFVLIFAVALKPFVALNPIFGTFIAMCVGLVLCSLLPIPYLAGGKIFFASVYLYAFTLGYLIIFSAMLLYSTFITTLFAAIIGGLAFLILYHLAHKK